MHFCCMVKHVLKFLNAGFMYLSLFICTDLHIEKEQAGSAAHRHQMACEAFGDGILPQLQSAVYKVAGQHRLSKRS